MNEIPRMGFFDGFTIARRIDREDGVEITTHAVPQPPEVSELLQAGWIQKQPNVFEYIFPWRYPDEDVLASG